jgi:hypothetical protein
VKSSLAIAIAIAALALTPVAAAANEPVMSVSVTVEVGSSGTAIAPEAPACAAPQLSMRLAQRPLRWRRGTPVLATGRSYRFAGRLLCDGVPAPAGTVVQGAGQVGEDGRIATRIAYSGGRKVAFAAHGATVRIAVRAAS